MPAGKRGGSGGSVGRGIGLENVGLENRERRRRSAGGRRVCLRAAPLSHSCRLGKASEQDREDGEGEKSGRPGQACRTDAVEENACAAGWGPELRRHTRWGSVGAMRKGVGWMVDCPLGKRAIGRTERGLQCSVRPRRRLSGVVKSSEKATRKCGRWGSVVQPEFLFGIAALGRARQLQADGQGWASSRGASTRSQQRQEEAGAGR